MRRSGSLTLSCGGKFLYAKAKAFEPWAVRTTPALALALLASLSGLNMAGAENNSTPPPEEWLVRAANVAPSPRQLAWQRLEFGALVHFGMNTYTDRAWGDGKEPARWFNPTNFDARQWVAAYKAAGMRLVVLTAKHHDGFCLWPTRTTDYSVRQSPWRNGQGDVVREVADACREAGLKFGIYLSPPDLHEPTFGTPAYIGHFSNQLRELLTHYGEITEVWFDGAKPGTVQPVYDFLAWRDLVRQLQPGAVIFGQGEDVRWIGNESGTARAAEWSVFPLSVPPEKFAGGNFMDSELGSRRKLQPAAHLTWWPAETPISIRPEWFFHGSENDRVKTTDQLLDLYLRHVGGNAFLMLNVPPNKAGLIPPVEVERLTQLGIRLKTMFAHDLAKGARINASSTRAGLPDVSAEALLDDRADTYWMPEDRDSQAEVILEFPSPTTFALVDLGEHLQTGQRIEQFSLEVDTESGWKQVYQGQTVGYRKLARLHSVTSRRLRLRILQSRLAPTLQHFRVFASDR